MPDLQIPNVAIEDLQTFQAKHFPGSVQPPALQYQYDETGDQLDDYNEDEEDDLGYYPDGVKRTLTDEQIKIFRHSEIHSLLREKQLREEALLEAAQETANEKAAEKHQLAASDADTKGSNDEKRADGLGASDSVLDYGEEASAGNGPNRVRPGHTSQFSGRRIISYDD